jgi:uncharacterized membrane protein YkvA (DUF1232 family)
MARAADRLKRRARAFKRAALVVRVVARDPRSPLLAKIGAGATEASASSPIDPAPDFVPAPGRPDGALLAPSELRLASKLTPPASAAFWFGRLARRHLLV